MIIAVVGPDATGKSTLARSIANGLGLPVLPSLREELLAGSGYHTVFEWDSATRGLDGVVTTQAAREAALTDAVVDGGVLELLALLQRWAWNRLSPVRFERLRGAAAGAAVRYQRVVVLPPRIVAAAAPGRFRCEENNQQVARLLDAFIAETSLPLLRISDVDEDGRAAEALAGLRR